MPHFEKVFVPRHPPAARFKCRRTVALVRVRVLEVTVERGQNAHDTHSEILGQVDGGPDVQDLLLLRVQEYVIAFLEIGATDHGPEFQIELPGEIAQSLPAVGIDVQREPYRAVRVNAHRVVPKPRRAPHRFLERCAFSRSGEVTAVADRIQTQFHVCVLSPALSTGPTCRATSDSASSPEPVWKRPGSRLLCNRSSPRTFLPLERMPANR